VVPATTASVEWTTAASLATAAGTLVLAIATFASVRSANRAARVAERGLEQRTVPLLFASRLEDATQKIRWGDDHWARLEGGRAVVEDVDRQLYMAISLRNVGSGNAVLSSWQVGEPPPFGAGSRDRPDPDAFRPQQRDLYVPSGDVAFWQAALRDPGDPDAAMVRKAISERTGLFVDLCYSDYQGAQRTISRFSLSPYGEGPPSWFCSVVLHWTLDRSDPRPH